MKRLWPHKTFCALLWLICIPWGALFAAPQFPALTGRVVDDAHLLSTDQHRTISGALANIEAQTTQQVVVVTLPSLQGYDVADYGYQLGRTWGIGQKDKNNGILLIVAPNERKVRIEVGYGLEETVTDTLANVIIQQTILPHFHSGDYAGGIEAGVNALAGVLTGKDLAYWQQQVRASAAPSSPVSGFAVFIIMAFFLLVFLRGGLGSALLAGSMLSGGIGRGPSDWGGGGSGPFSGGGGSFGGGGSSGSW